MGEKIYEVILTHVCYLPKDENHFEDIRISFICFLFFSFDKSPASEYTKKKTPTLGKPKMTLIRITAKYREYIELEYIIRRKIYVVKTENAMQQKRTPKTKIST